MVFSSIGFLCLFFPVAFLGYHLIAVRWQNTFLALASIVFYAWGEPRFVILMLLSVALNFKCARTIHGLKEPAPRKFWLLLSVSVNLLLLVVFKYTEFILENVNALLQWQGAAAPLPVPTIALPIGISFYTFHAISYLMDVYRKNATPNDSLTEYSLYIMLFPQLVAGPIIRYKDIHAQLRSRRVTLTDVEEGLYRFVLGLSKKVLIANPLGLIADAGFDAPASDLTTGAAWLSLGAYALQIYFDFSGYSDMAIGLARLFGFAFPENFNYPYRAHSVQDFWRRWHISLSTWFRDYVYIPLGGNRQGAVRTWLNLWLVFVLTGLWHGASWNFVIWGALHGFFLMCEKVCGQFAGSWPRLPKPLMQVYTLGVVLLAWVFFRAGTTPEAWQFVKVLAGQAAEQAVPLTYSVSQAWSIGVLFALALCLAMGCYPRLHQRLQSLRDAGMVRAAIALPLLALSMTMLALGQYNPFIYFRF